MQRLVECVLRFDERGDFAGVGGRLGVRGALLALAPAPLGAPRLLCAQCEHAAEPAARTAGAAQLRPRPQRREQRLLNEVIGLRRVGDQLQRQRAHPAQLALQRAFERVA